MGKIEFTNLIIDSFSQAQKDTSRLFIHILTHIHTDHLKGLSDGWNYGPIYCTQITRKLLNIKFPSLSNFVILQVNTPTIIKMGKDLSLKVTFLQANHCAGAVMVLIEGYIGRILYTGDMRFNRQIFMKNKILYPSSQSNDQFNRCSIKIDVLYIDNTFLKPRYNFPPQKKVLQLTLNYIQEVLKSGTCSRIYVGLDNYGKQQVLLQIAKKYQIYIIVDQIRFSNIQAMGYDSDYFSTNPQQGFIQVVAKNKLSSFLKDDPDSIGIILTGWVNQPRYRQHGKIYCLPYSLHSNYQQIHDFVASVGPTQIYQIVHECPTDSKLPYQQDMQIEDNKYQIDQLKKYCTPASQQFKFLMENISFQKQIINRLKIPQTLAFQNIQKLMALPPVSKTGAEKKKMRFSRKQNEQQFIKLKNQIQLKKNLINQANNIILIDDDKKEQQILNIFDDQQNLDLCFDNQNQQKQNKIENLKQNKHQQQIDLWQTVPSKNKSLQKQTTLLSFQNYFKKKSIDTKINVNQQQKNNSNSAKRNNQQKNNKSIQIKQIPKIKNQSKKITQYKKKPQDNMISLINIDKLYQVKMQKNSQKIQNIFNSQKFKESYLRYKQQNI